MEAKKWKDEKWQQQNKAIARENTQGRWRQRRGEQHSPLGINLERMEAAWVVNELQFFVVEDL